MSLHEHLHEHFSTINLINGDEIEFDSSIQNIHKIKSILLDLESNSFKNIVKNEIECFYSQINNCSPKERLVITTLINISKTPERKNSEFLSYKDIFPPSTPHKESDTDNITDKIDYKIFEAVSRVSHKTLHKNEIKEGKPIKRCEIYNKTLSDKEFNENNYRDYNNIDKLINNAKEKNEILEFIAIKSIVISMINLIEELINNNYFSKSENLLSKNNEEYIISEEDENTIIIFKPNLFENIYNDYIFTSNMCPFLENYFIDSFNNFRQKYQISFTLTELLTDIFWNSIFHNKILCKKFINIYIGNDIVCENIRNTLNKIIKIIRDISVPIKSKLYDLLNLNHLENKDDIDLMTSIAKQKNITHELSKNENIINNVNKTSINREYMSIINDNENNNENGNENNNEKNNNEKNNDERNNKNKNNDSNNKKSSLNVINEDNLENKTLDEVYNYINNNMENKNNNNKKKKRAKKKKNKKMENEMKAFNEENSNKNINTDEDQIVLEFKKEIEQDVINAYEINKVKPVVSEKWLKKISNNN